jgi:UDP-2,4-diacetamido-2,4,6-trideoxy-beta-L-altropyranose hydrolase
MASRCISFVTTAHAAIGMGHLRRCLTLADVLRKRGAFCRFLVYNGDPALRDLVQTCSDLVVIRRDFALDEALHEAEKDSLVVVDSYDVRAYQLRRLLDRKARVLAIDDLADQALPATWLLNSCVMDHHCYRGLTDASLLLGPHYALLRPQFRDLPGRGMAGPVRRVLLTFGGSDVMHLTKRVLRVLEAVPGSLHIRVAAGQLAGEQAPAAGRHMVEFLRDVSNMAEQMTWADLAITTAGQTMFELAAAGCPALCLQVADNQRHTGELFDGIGSVVVKDARRICDEDLEAVTLNLMDHVEQRGGMSRAGQAVVDGRGADRVACVLQASYMEPRP